MTRPVVPLACVVALACSWTTPEPQEGNEEPVQQQNVRGHEGRKPLPSPEEIAKLPPDGGPEYNRLIFEQSPYLLQHAANPVDWYPWGDAAFERARADDKPIFLSIGYSTCHWCHVMERESFEDPEIAALMNAAFVCIKVDREERPDVDHLYMQVTQAMTGSGGWPMTVVMTPDKKPFFAGTYFPKDERFGRRGMRQLVPDLSGVWKNQREQVLAHADSVADFMRRSSEGAVGGELGAEVLGLAFRQLSDAYEPEFGGFGDQPKFPTPHNLLFLLQYHQRRGDSEALAMVEHTLQRMRLGGIFDQVGFGFHRYSTDRRWLVPHFEKMLYDQAMLVMAYTAAWQVTGKDRYRATAEEVLAYVQRDMTSPEGAFYSAEDADSEGEEGRFYLWTTAELREVLGEDEGRLVARVFGATEEGNFAEGSEGANILHLEQPLDEQAEGLGLTADALRGRVEAARAKLFAVRERRVHPMKDDKVLTDWNGLMIAALARAGRAFDEPRHVAAAARAADFLLANVRADDGRMLKRFRLGAAGLPGTLDDHAFLAWGLLELYEATLEPRWLREALALTDAMVAHFRDAEQGGFFIAADDVEGLLSRGKDAYDGAIPSGTSVAAWNLLRLARITGRTELEEEAAATLRSFSASVARQPAAYTQLLAAVDLAVGPSFEIVVAGDPAAADTRAMLAAFQRRFLPHKVLLLRPPGEAPPITELAPYTLEQTSLDGRATAFVCRDFACKEPTTDVETALGFLDPAAWKK